MVTVLSIVDSSPLAPISKTQVVSLFSNILTNHFELQVSPIFSLAKIRDVGCGVGKTAVTRSASTRPAVQRTEDYLCD